MEKQEVKITGRIFDQQTGTPLSGVKITSQFSKITPSTTDKDGYFTTDVSVKQTKVEDLINIRPKLIYTLKGYVPSSQEILSLDGKLKTELPVKSLVNIKEAANQGKIELQNSIDKAKGSVNEIYLEGSEILIVAKRKSIMSVVDVVKSRLVPLAIEMLISFGISKLSQRSQKVCPTPDQLKQNIQKRNSVVRQLNQIYSSLALNTSLAIAFLAISKALGGVRRTIDNLPFPLVSSTYNTVASLQNVKDTLKELEESNKDLNKQILIALVFLVASLAIILVLLKGIDDLIGECSEGTIPFDEISDELLQLTNDASEDGIPKIQQLDGFNFSVETEKNTVGSLKRRFAVAKNSSGVTILKGEPSFSSTDQILVDELIFYIQQNNLKAF